MVLVESWLTSPGRSTIRSAVLGEAHGECGAGVSGFDADVCAEFADQRESHAPAFGVTLQSETAHPDTPVGHDHD